MTFQTELTALINKYSKEVESQTPDFLLAEYLVKCLDTYATAVIARDAWSGAK